MAVTVNDPEYLAALARFNRQLRVLYRAAGEPPYREVAEECRVSVTSVHRYLTGAILPRSSFISKFINAYGAQIFQLRSTDELLELRDRWAAVRDVLKPIEPEDQTGAAPLRLVIDERGDDGPPEQRRHKSA